MSTMTIIVAGIVVPALVVAAFALVIAERGERDGIVKGRRP